MPATTALYSLSQIRAVELAALAGLAPGILMQRAGKAAAAAAMELLQDPHGTARVLVIAGPGNNGGDALEAAACLTGNTASVSVLLLADPGRQSADAQQALARARSSDALFLEPSHLTAIASTPWSLVIDGLFGIGLARPVSGMPRALIEIVNRLACPVLALDIPSGLDADSGAIVGPDGIGVRATHTITFIGNKPGLHTAQGRDHAGTVQVADLEIDGAVFPEPVAQLNHADLFAHASAPRLHDSHKGSHGDVAIVGGARGMAGAAILASRAALKCGAGRVFAGFLDQPPLYDGEQPEIMCRLAGELDFSRATVVVGPGLGTSRAAHDMLAHALNSQASLVIDADALNLISAEPGLQHKLTQRSAGTLLTPHPLEAGRLLGRSGADVQSDRIAAARDLSGRFNATVVLKGSGTIIAQSIGAVVVNITGNPGLATAGTGDVLAGICGALLAQHWPVWEAALCAVWMHGKAADTLVEQGVGPAGLTAGELIPHVRAALNTLVANHARCRRAL